jgi:hypothetical protein
LGRAVVALVAFGQPLARGVLKAAAALQQLQKHQHQHQHQQYLLSQHHQQHYHHHQEEFGIYAAGSNDDDDGAASAAAAAAAAAASAVAMSLRLAAVLAICEGVAFAAVPFALHSCIFYVFSQVSHIQEECFEPRATVAKAAITDGANAAEEEEGSSDESSAPQLSLARTTTSSSSTSTTSNGGSGGERGRGCDWAVHQVSTTADWGTDSTVWLYLSNGLNHQTLHHLFPQVNKYTHK